MSVLFFQSDLTFIFRVPSSAALLSPLISVVFRIAPWLIMSSSGPMPIGMI